MDFSVVPVQEMGSGPWLFLIWAAVSVVSALYSVVALGRIWMYAVRQTELLEQIAASLKKP